MNGLTGILGGMGPQAGLYLARRFVELSAAETDQQHLPFLLYSQPNVPDRTNAIVYGGPSPLHAMRKGIEFLNRNRVDVITIACNSAHFYFNDLASASTAPIIHIADAVLNDLKSYTGLTRVGLLATEGTIHSKIYHDRLERSGYQCITLGNHESNKLVNYGIRLAKANILTESRNLFLDALTRLRDAGAETTILGCTEIPMALFSSSEPIPHHVVDASSSLAKAAIRFVQRQSGSHTS